MTPLTLAILLFALGAIILFAELLLPSHGVLGLLGIACLAAAVVACFFASKWLGLGAFLALLLLSPVVGIGFVKLYPKTPIGKRMILGGEATIVRPPPVHIGQVGVAVSHLRPSGEVEFETIRVEVTGEGGMIENGARVKVVAINHGQPVVRQV